MQTHIYITVESTSPRVTEKWYGYILEGQGRNGIVTREGFGVAAGTYNQVSIIVITEALRRFKRPAEIVIHIDNNYVLQMCEKNLARWEENGFMTAKDKPVKNRDEWRALSSLYWKHSVMGEVGKHTYSSWLHEEIKRRKDDV